MSYRLPTRSVMMMVTIAGGMSLMPLLAAQPAAAQSSSTVQNLVPESEAVSIQASIASLNKTTRVLRLVGPTGDSVTMVAGPAIRLGLLKVGDRVNAKFFRSVAFALNGPQDGVSVPVSNDQFAQLSAQPVQAPGGVVLRLIKISGTVVGIDLSSHSLNVVNPSGGRVYTLDVTNPARIALLSSLKVGIPSVQSSVRFWRSQ